MAEDVETLTYWLRFFLIVASVCATLFPISYAFAPWFRSGVGRALMLQSVAFAMALDLTLAFQYWDPGVKHILLAFWIEVIVFALISVATTTLTVMLVMGRIRARHIPKPREYDGTIEVTVNKAGSKVYSLTLDSDPEHLDEKNEVLFKVDTNNQGSST